MSVAVSCVLVPGLLCPRRHSARAPPSVTRHPVALVGAACSSSQYPQRVPPAGGTSCRRRPRPSLTPALPRCLCAPVAGGGTRPPLFRASSPRPRRLLRCLERLQAAPSQGGAKAGPGGAGALGAWRGRREPVRLNSASSLCGVASCLHVLVTPLLPQGVSTWLAYVRGFPSGHRW